jgi:RNA recognition motif-containing protein
MNIYVGNLSFNTDEDGLRECFQAKGEVSSAVIIKDRETGRSRGFGFVEMPSNDEGNEAINSLNGYELDGRALKINEARPREDNRGGGGGGGRY